MRIGIVGCGQLARMMAYAGLPMGIDFSFVAVGDEDTVCVQGLGDIVNWRIGDATADLYEKLGKPDCITVEREQVELELMGGLNDRCRLSPNLESIETCQSRIHEKRLLESLNIPSAAYAFNGQANECVDALGLPLVIKSCKDGYDGKAQWRVKDALEAAQFDYSQITGDYIIEQFIHFDREISQVSVRSNSGEIQHYALAENTHTNGILSKTIVPAPEVDPAIQEKAHRYITDILVALNYVGVLAMECFVVGDDLLVNELAPRVHNSGHWTQQGSFTSQFANHIRAIAGMPPGITRHAGFFGMVNLIGCEKPDLAQIPSNGTLHWYNKAVRPGRKLGHVNFVEDSAEALAASMEAFLFG